MRQSQAMLRYAVWTSVSQCSPPRGNLYRFGEFLDKLRDDGWEPEDVREVERQTLHYLDKIAEGRLQRSA